MQAIFALCNQTLIAIGLYTPLFKPALSRTFLSAKLSPLAQKLNCFYGRGIATNVFGLCVRAGFGAQNCQRALNLNRSTKLQVCTSPRLTQNPCYALCFLSFVTIFLQFFFCVLVTSCFDFFKFSQAKSFCPVEI